MTEGPLRPLLAELARAEDTARVARSASDRAEARARLLTRAAALADAERAALQTELARVDAFIFDQLTPMLGETAARRALRLAAGRDPAQLTWADSAGVGATLVGLLTALVGPDVAAAVGERINLGAALWTEVGG